MRMADDARLLLAIAFVLQLPAEVADPLVRVGPIGITNLELTGYLFASTWVISVIWAWTPRPQVGTVTVALLVMVLLGAAVATASALTDVGASLKVLLRFGAAIVIGLALASEVIHNPRRGVVAAAAVVAAVVSAGFGILEYMTGWSLLGGFYGLFRDAPVSVGGFVVRATGTVLHPNLAAWYWGVAGTAITAYAVASRHPRALLLGILAFPLFLAEVLALSRGAVVGTAAAAIVASTILVRRGVSPMRAAAVALPLVLVVGVVALSSPAARARLVSEADQEWYRFAITAPPSLDLSERVTLVEVTVHNNSPIGWQRSGHGAVAVGYHMRDTDDEYILYGGGGVPLPEDLPPGGSAAVVLRVIAPHTTPVTIEWDLEQPGQTWFSSRLSQPLTTTRAVVSYDPPPGEPAPDDPSDAPTAEDKDLYTSRSFTRSDLWRIAIEMLAARPLIGIGLDNYRHSYGAWAGLSTWDTDFNATNLYLEIVVGMGVAGVLVFVVSTFALIRALRRSLQPHVGVNFAALLILVSFSVHGIFDSFITFSTAMYLTAAAAAVGLLEGLQASQA
jgi:O-antigen ligase/polysaccharide polymerase Wzy-like membrane protein